MSTRRGRTRASRTCSPKSTCAAPTMRPSGWEGAMSTSSSADSFAPRLFADRHILVVGGTSGIGDGIATAFAALGGDVLVTGATAVEAEASEHRAVALDVRDEAAVHSVVSALPAL